MALTVTPQWKIVVKGTDNRYHEVCIDPQDDFGHARSLALAYASRDPDRPDFVPDARVIREGAVVGLLDALRALVDVQGPQELADAKLAIHAATDPHFDIGVTVETFTLQNIRDASRAGAVAYGDGRTRAEVPSDYDGSETLQVAWLRGWEGAAIQGRPKPR